MRRLLMWKQAWQTLNQERHFPGEEMLRSAVALIRPAASRVGSAILIYVGLVARMGLPLSLMHPKVVGKSRV